MGMSSKKQNSTPAAPAKARPNASFGSPQSAPVAKSTPFRAKQPRVASANGRCNVAHVERIGTIAGSVAFAVTAFAINPGLIATFPWLSGVAARYESYRFKRLRFWLRSKCSTAFVGDVSMAIDFDAADTPPTTSVQLENYDGAVNDMPWTDQWMDASALNLRKELVYYVRTAALSSNLDIKTYDLGNLYVGTEGQANTSTVAYLYADYEVELTTPQLSFESVVLGGAITGAGTQSAANPFGTTASADAQALGVAINASSVVTLSYPGTYLVAGSIGGTVLSALTGTGSTGVTGSIAASGLANAAGTALFYYGTYVSTVANGTITFAATATTVTSAIAYIAVAPTSSLSAVPEELTPYDDVDRLRAEVARLRKALRR